MSTISDFKAAVDTDITNKTAVGSITPTIVGGRVKDLADIVDTVKVPTGGAAGQILAKASNADNNTQWIDAPAGSGGAPSLPSISGLVHDFDFGDETAMTVVNGKITQITDSVSGLVSAQGDVSKQPVLQTVGGAKNKPYALFTGSESLSGSLFNFSSDCTMIILKRRGGNSDSTSWTIQGLLQQGDGNGFGIAEYMSNPPHLGYRNVGGYVPGITELTSDMPANPNPYFQSYAFTYEAAPSDAKKFKMYDGVGAWHSFLAGDHLTPNAPSGGHSIGAGFGQYNFIGGMQRVLIYNRALSQAEIQSISSYFIAYYALPKITYFTAIGDSISSGVYPSATVDPYPDLVSYKLLNLGRNLYAQNKAVSGDTTQNLLARLQADVLNYLNPNVNNVVSVMIGHNQSSDSSDTYTGIVNICRQCKNAGYKVIVHTLINDANSSENSIIGTINAKIRNTWANFADAICDSNAIPQLSDPTNSTYYVDGTHPTQVGTQLIADLLQPIVERFLA